MIFRQIILSIILVSAGALFINNIKKYLSAVKAGKITDKLRFSSENLKRLITHVFGHKRLLKDSLAGAIHLAIFWGFLFFLFSFIDAILTGYGFGFLRLFPEKMNSFIAFVLEIFAVAILLAIIMASLRRFVFKIPRLKAEEPNDKDAIVIFGLISLIVLSFITQNLFAPEEIQVSFLSIFLRELFGLQLQGNTTAFEIALWTHIICILAFLNYLPFSKHLHVLTSIPGVLFKDIDSPKKMTVLDLEGNESGIFGLEDVSCLDRREILDSLTCTECGRCTAACPANRVNKPLSPRKLMINLRKAISNEASGKIDFSSEEIWSCTTCMACAEACPVLIDHLNPIIESRRNYVLTKAEMPEELNVLFRNLENYSSPWNMPQSERVAWTEGLSIPVMAEKRQAEYLLWVGCAGAFDPRYQKVIKKFANLLQKANIDFGILGIEEKCNGDAARRLGNEYLAQMLITENIETLKKYNVKKIITACPHCYNTFRNDYPSFGGKFEVYHHSEILAGIVAEQKLVLDDKLSDKTFVFHDSCYLGRYNGLYQAPRSVMRQVVNDKTVEFTENRDNGMCCGAGGGRMFMEDKSTERINNLRVRQALETKADVICTACPFCLTMLEDGIKSIDEQNNVVVKDISEIINDTSN